MNERDRAAPLVTASQVATVADVGPSAVSNWRKRFEDFPRAVQTTPGGKDLFDLEEVETWLTRHGRLGESKGKRLLFMAAEQLRSQVSAEQMVEVIGAALALVAVERRGSGPPREAGLELESSLRMAAGSGRPDLDRAFRPLLSVDVSAAEDVLRLVHGIEETELSECFEWILSRGQRPHGTQNDSGAVLTSLVGALVGDADGVVYDPAAGLGGFLLTLWEKGMPLRRPQLFGQELDESASTIAQQRFIVENVPVTMTRGDSLTDDAWPNLRADVVVSDPPYGVRKNWPSSLDGDPRWVAGRPPAITDFAWLQHITYHLKDEGRGYLFLPVGTLFRRGKDANLRRELLAEGVVEAIVKLPPGSSPRASIPLALWILRSSHRGGSGASVLLVDATAASDRKALGEKEIERVTRILNEWRLDQPIPEQDRVVAASVPVFDLVRRDANLDPSRWLSSDLTPADRSRQETAFEQTKEALDETRRALAALPEVHGVLATAESRPWIEVDQLIADEVARTIRGVRIKEEDCLPAGTPVVRPGDVRNGFAAEPTCFADLAIMRPQPELTRQGDVIVSPAGDRLVAAVDERGGRILAAPVQGLRLVDQFIEPVLLAAFLESPRNRRLLSGTVQARVHLPDLEIPIFRWGEQQELTAALKILAEQEHLSQKVSTGTKSLRELLLSLASSSRGE